MTKQVSVIFSRFGVLFLALMSAFTAVRFIEFTFVHLNHYVEGFPGIISRALAADIKTTLIFSVVVLPIYFLPLRIYRVLSLLFTIIFIVFNTLLTFYFVELLEPLDSSLYKHSFQESVYVIREFGVFRWVYITVIIPPLLFWLFTERRFSLRAWVVVPVLFSIIVHLAWNLERTGFNSSQAYYLASNKTCYFLQSSFKSQTHAHSADAVNDIIKAYQSNSDKNFVSTTYPLLHKSKNENVLAPFFNLDENNPPNVVFIVVESLSASFSNNFAKEFSLTPFLDSLAEHSLYFERFLSVGQRTFSVFPSGLASLPHGKKGFINLGHKMPNHQSIPKTLINNGYSGAFFYGGSAKYSYYDVFMNLQGIDQIYGQADFQPRGNPIDSEIETMGVDDRPLFRNAMNALDSIGEKTPYFHVYLTLTMHQPFRFNEQEEYIPKVKELIKSLPEREKYEKYLQSLSTVLYTDDVLSEFFADYQKRAEYENTIFIILGDHRISAPQTQSAIATYHVPLLIYSPLLKRTKTFKALNTHNRLAPSLFSLLNGEYGYTRNDTVHWLGDELDTAGFFRGRQKAEIMLNNSQVEHYLYDEYFYCFGKLYQIHEDFSLTLVDDEEIIDKVETQKHYERVVSEYAVQNNKIYPEEKNTSKQTLIDKQHGGAVSLGPKTEYQTIIRYGLEENRSRIDCELEFEFLNELGEYEKDSLPVLVVSVKYADDKKDFWSGYSLDDLLIYENNTTVQFSNVLRDGEEIRLDKGDTLMVYFWNKSTPKKTFIYRKNKVSLYGFK